MARTISTTYSTGITLTNTADNPITVTGTITPSTGTALYGQGGGTNSWTITNSGLISATSSGASGVVLGSPASPVAPGLVTNQATGTLSGYAFGVSINPTGSVANAGAISGGTAGVYLGNTTYSPNAGSVTNLTGGIISSTNIGVDISGSGSVTNQSGGTISGVNVAAVSITGYGSVQQTAVNVYNVGTLSGAIGVAEYRGGSVTNLADGTITGTINAGISLAGPGTVVNAGLVTGAVTGVDLFEGGTVDNLAGGTISAASGVYIGYVGTTGGTFTNAGTVVATGGGADAVQFKASAIDNRLIVDPGAVFSGNIDGGNGTAELATGSGIGTLSGFGGTITNFSTLQFDQGARWGISGDATGLGAIGTITGFAGGDTIDLTGFAATGATFASNKLTLTGASTATVTLDVAGNFTSSDFQIASDGAGGSDITLQPRTFNWTGGTGNWNTPSAWDVGSVPSSVDSAVIAQAGTNAITVNDSETVANVTLNGADDTVAVVGGGFLGATGSITIDAGTLSDTGGFATPQITDDGVLNIITNSTQSLDFTPVSLGGTLAVSSNVGGTLLLGAHEVVTQGGANAVIGSSGTAPANAVENQGSIDAGVLGGTMAITPTSFINQGTIAVSNGDTLDVSSPVTSGGGSGTIDIGGSGIADFAASVDAGQTLAFTDATGMLKLAQPSSFLAPIQNIAIGNTIDLTSTTADAANWAGNVLTVSNGGTAVTTLAMPGNFSGYTFGVASDGATGSDVTVTATCYAAGTRILTPRGEVPIERLHRDDLVLTISGQAQPIRWIGHRRVDFRSHSHRQRVLPVRIAAHAFGPGRPERDLLLSPDHAVFVEGVLIPIRHLINGSNVAQVERQTITYYHIELPRHDVLLAEGMPAESYLEAGARNAFANSDDVIQLHPEFAPRQDYYATLWEQYGYAPLVVAGEVVERIRDTLAEHRYAA